MSNMMTLDEVDLI